MLYVCVCKCDGVVCRFIPEKGLGHTHRQSKNITHDTDNEINITYHAHGAATRHTGGRGDKGGHTADGGKKEGSSALHGLYEKRGERIPVVGVRVGECESVRFMCSQ